MQPLDHPEPTPAPSSPRNLFSSFRTHLNVPIPLFGSRSAPSQAHTGKQTQLYDLEAQRFDIPRRGSGVIIPTVKTSIRSGPAPFVLPHATSVPAAIHEEEDEDIDPLAPKMGTRAYREREKREMQRRKDEEKVAKVIADDVKVEMGGGSVGKGKEFASVIKIVKSFDLSEESKAGRS
ncbi:uncharacterized protein LY89DRAFT_721757 [Mollisia scopiformis]|uniref:Uncharacterized protein n=1 Tax=Mollisia scopiformis TaxID=149040 RepID=A0A194WYB8_MOLSC|nr:uncharacterized protein LY89DRAFT_721757 [Mollisia scopiformis]KUJ12930.1 hypothetical protein LY89DRAFT_721757 [Mollisia scopiformis]